MEPQIFDYSECVQDHCPNTLYMSLNRTPFFQRPGWCPYCKTSAESKYKESYCESPEDDSIYHDPCLDQYYYLHVWICPTCGWWDMHYAENSGHDSIDPSMGSESLFHGVLRTFRVSDLKVPVDVLRRALESNPNILFHIHHRKMEELVESIFSDFYPNCDVAVCGKSGDGGIDLILVRSDTPIAIQVKRRTSPTSVERVQVVREFLGACLLGEFRHGIFVSTADHFTNGKTGAKAAARRAKEHKLVHELELIDRGQFLDITRAASAKPIEPWIKYVPSAFQERMK